MKKIDVVASATVYDDVSELPSDIQLLMNKAIEARKKHMRLILNFKLALHYY